MKITLSPDAPFNEADLQRLDTLFDSAPPEALVYSGRNTLKIIRIGQAEVVAKRFRKPDIFKRLGNLVKGSKAIRAFNHAARMRTLNLPTPSAWAAVEHAPSGHDYLLTAIQPGRSLEDTLPDPLTNPATLASELAAFALRLHSKGILHQDFNDTNIRVMTEDDGAHSFAIIDINRMDIFEGMPPYRARLDSLQRFSRFTPFYRMVLRAYLDAAGEYSESRYLDEQRRKQRRDRRRDRKKRFLYALKRLLP